MASVAPGKRASPNVFTIAPGLPFASVLVKSVLDGSLGLPPMRDDPMALASLVIHVPTQRIRALLIAEFARAVAPRGAILPDIRALADPGDPLDDAIDAAMAGDSIGDLPEARRMMSGGERRFRLVPLVTAWLETVHSERADAPGAASAGLATREHATRLPEVLRLAGALGQLIDEMAIEGVPLERLESVAPQGFDPARFDRYWWTTRDFLRLSAHEWPSILTALNATDAMARRVKRLSDMAKALEQSGTDRPMIIAGSTGSVRATAELMRVVARLPNGAVVLPGLDQLLDDGDDDGPGWHAIGADDSSYASRFAHPQAMLKRTLGIIGVERGGVRELGVASPGAAARNRFLSEALRPAETSAAWQAMRPRLDLDAALSGLSAVMAPDQGSEALAIAILIRETLETPEKTVMLVTADRALARRVQAELARWGIMIEDSGGSRLGEAPCGALARLMLQAAATGTGSDVLALLRHPMMRLGYQQPQFRELVDALELLVLRGRHFTSGLPWQKRAISALLADPPRPGTPAARIPQSSLDELPGFCRRLDDLLEPFGKETSGPLGSFVSALTTALIDATTDDLGEAALLADASWRSLVDLLEQTARDGNDCQVAAKDFGSLIELMLGETRVPAGRAGHPRAAILGLLEARLVQADRIIIGGLYEGSLPPQTDSDLFLNRAMRIGIGLQPPERRIGQSAHDLAMLAAGPDLWLTSALRVGTKPAIPSRFLRRMEALAGEAWKAVVARGVTVLALASRIDRPDDPPRPIAAPEIVPAIPRLPERLSITEVETLRRDPYALYAKRILGLEPLEPLDPAADSRDRGTMVHRILEAYSSSEPPRDPQQAEQTLRDLARAEFAKIRDDRELQHFWWQSFEAIIPGFVAFDREARDSGRSLLLEARARLPLDLPCGETVTLSGRIDRIEIELDASATRMQAHVLDYKSGMPPKTKQVIAGYSPQLTITGGIIAAGGVAGLPAGTVIASLAYLPTGGKVEVAPQPITPKEITLDEAIRQRMEWLFTTLDSLGAGRVPYRAQIAKRSLRDDGPYDHLARIREWSVVAEDADPASDVEEEGP